ncbi:hypothetical protein CXF86_18915 [Shewanella sp. GutCb]|uniref:hypothetical protein n=1 Tax=Shewanella sp. GutCb TaxID=2058315 RepID=UPI000C797BC8|nr:hypothetical protein [Shewanella sp. GutCb]PKG73178.1 hypothetical protein CXF86_18915 [Shewanella sp. GutCb]
MFPKWVTPEIIIAISSVFIALCALVTTLWLGLITRKHNKLSVKPMLSLVVLVSRASEKIGLKLTNDGFGPAIITKGVIKKNGQEFELRDIKYRSLFPELSDNDFQLNLIGAYCSRNPLQDQWLVSSIAHKEHELTANMTNALSQVELRVEYESVYAEKFTFSQIISFEGY